MSIIFDSLRFPLELSLANLRDTSSAACKYRARFGNDIGSLGYGRVSEYGIVYVFEIGVSALSRRRLGGVDNVYDQGNISTSPIVYFRAFGMDGGTGWSIVNHMTVLQSREAW